MSILLTGGAGFIGSHTALVLLEAGYDVVILDNLCNASRESLSRVEEITGRDLSFIEGDIRDGDALDALFARHAIEAVVHFAGLKAVGESTARPLAYYDNNVTGTLSLCEAMQRAGVFTLVFSSSATVYTESSTMPLAEDAPTGRPSNPYGSSKLMIEWLLRDLQAADPRWSIALLRYFNPVGAHDSGRIGEDPNGMPNNLLPFIAQVAVGRRERVSVFGSDYSTPDGTGVRDYIHVMDLAEGHRAALDVIRQDTGCRTWNLGTGRGYSVLEMITAFERASGRPVPFDKVGRRQGDVAQCWADVTRAGQELGWRAERGLDDIMADAWRWQSANPYGYRG
ncbi:UDP-glucose 4-epimerase GalE [Salinisphaera sp. Q1T1-3]|uniref:UDP-glucose 4-epimerase GalE n=1 Tax=Salinisphaera sp. Q1T1-3 TaxID=2321229 RepID=UPI000E75F520|nr:UDP-glucose 4-epimerase GalE [Salinisphaera sp. Q1T1-3]RJS94737.1 UDP-glucose 4-epimerase GalE [Salinisphaera sp. Q1T1-3]